MFTLKYDLSQPEIAASYLHIAKKRSYATLLPITILFAILMIVMFTMTSMLTSSNRIIFLIVYSIILLFFASSLLALLSLPSQLQNTLKNAKPQQITFFNDEFTSQTDSSETTYSYHFYNRFQIKNQWLILYVRQNSQKQVARLHPDHPTNVSSQLVSLHCLTLEEIDDLSRFLANRIHR